MGNEDAFYLQLQLYIQRPYMISAHKSVRSIIIISSSSIIIITSAISSLSLSPPLCLCNVFVVVVVANGGGIQLAGWLAGTNIVCLFCNTRRSISQGQRVQRVDIAANTRSFGVRLVARRTSAVARPYATRGRWVLNVAASVLQGGSYIIWFPVAVEEEQQVDMVR